MAIPNAPTAYLAEHYVYEINMLRWAHATLAATPEGFAANALIESFCVHARALWDFYAPPSNPKPDDVSASDFIASSQFSTTATSQLTPDLRQRINKQIAHLTIGRENPAKKVDDLDRQMLLTAIEADHAAFKNAVDPQYANCFADEKPNPPTIYVTGQIPASATSAIQFSNIPVGP